MNLTYNVTMLDIVLPNSNKIQVRTELILVNSKGNQMLDMSVLDSSRRAQVNLGADDINSTHHLHHS